MSQENEQLQRWCEQYVSLKDNLDQVRQNVKTHRENASKLKKTIESVLSSNPGIQIPLRDGRTVVAKKSIKKYPLNNDIMASAIDYAIERCRTEQNLSLKDCFLDTLQNMRENASSVTYTLKVNNVPQIQFNPNNASSGM